MISKSMSWRKTNRPILLRPVGKDYLWGGNRLRQEYHKNLPQTPLAETWECSTHSDGECIVASGIYKGKGLGEVIRLHPEWLGTHCRNAKEIPVLIKFIDAAKDLSVQVHPDDEYAWRYENQSGKTEMWYVLEAEPDASLIYGFVRDMTVHQVVESIQEGKLLQHLQKIPVKKNDVFFIQPGTVHAIGKGVVIAEIQECSNVTYRLYDYDRVDRNGEKRPLHVEKAIDVLNLKKASQVRQQMRLMRYHPGAASEVLCRCKYFQVDRVLMTERYRFEVTNASFQVLLVLEGDLRIGALSVRKGDCIFLPADCGKVEIVGKGQFLQVFC